MSRNIERPAGLGAGGSAEAGGSAGAGESVRTGGPAEAGGSMETGGSVRTGGSAGEVRIRTELLPGDLGYVAYLHGLIYSRENNFGLGFEGYVLKGLGEFAMGYDPAKDRVWVCEVEGRMVGFLSGIRREEGVAQLRYFILLPEYRGTGLGKRLMQQFMEWLRDSGYRRAYLLTTEEQEAAVALYLRHGFRCTEEKETSGFGKILRERRYDWTAG